MGFANQDFQRIFKTDDDCLEYIFQMRFPTVKCPKCARISSYHRNRKKQCYTCNCGQSHIYPKKSTIFEGSPVPMKSWFYAILLMTQNLNGVSAKELERTLGVTYPTAWRMANKIRNLIPTGEARQADDCFEVTLLKAITLPASALTQARAFAKQATA